MEFKDVFINTSDYELCSDLQGEGTFGKVYLARKIDDDEPHYVAKIIKADSQFISEEQRKFLCESLILHNLNHPLIVKFIGASFQSFSDPTKFEPTIITEFLPNGSLDRMITNGNLSTTSKCIFLLGISNAMKYLHEQGIIHRDLKPANILIDNNNYPCICDFGISRCFPYSLTKSMKMSLSDGQGTAKYMAPELSDDIDDHFSPTIDVFSFGILAYEIVTGIEAYSELGKITSIKLCCEVIKGYRPKFPDGVPQKMIDLISKCWSGIAEERPSFAEIYETLSNDLSYFGEKIDDEVYKFIEKLSLVKNENKKSGKKDPKQICIEKLEEENKQLREEITQIKQEYEKTQELKQSSSSNNDLVLFAIEINRYISVLQLCYQNVGFLSSEIDPSDFIENLYTGCNFLSIYHKKAIEYQIEQEQGVFNDYLKIGDSYVKKKESRKNYARAIKYYKKALRLVIANSVNFQGMSYYKGVIEKRDNTKAFESFQNAAYHNIPVAFYNLGHCYLYGIGVEKDCTKAIECYQKAADLGYASSFNHLGVLYYKGKGVKQDYKKAFECYHKAADLNYSVAFYNLGNSYFYGIGVEQNYEKAFECYQKASDLDFSGGFYNLGNCYFNGNGVEQNYEKAFTYYQKAAYHNIPAAFIKLGNCYFNGNGVEQNYGKAFTYYQKAAYHNIPAAFYNIGNCYFDSKGVKQDYTKAIQYYQKAADLDYTDSIFKLGSIYETGKGADKDISKAIEYYQKAAISGNEEAKLKLIQLNSNKK